MYEYGDHDYCTAQYSAESDYQVFCDGAGMPSHIEDERKEIVWWASRTDPWGKIEVHDSARIEYHLRWPGHYFDQETGLHCKENLMATMETEWELQFDQPSRQPSARSSADLTQAIERTFEYPQDGVTITWHGHKFRLPYTYGLSDILDDTLEMLHALTEDHGAYKVAFSASEPDGLDADWALSWTNDELTIDAEWRSVPGGLTQPMREGRALHLSRAAFARSWVQVLEFLCDSVIGVELDHDDEVVAVQALATAFQKIVHQSE